MSPIVEAGIIAGGAAVLSSIVTGLLASGITRQQVRSAERTARLSFLSERQADTYVRVCNQVSRVEAWANVAEQTIGGHGTDLERPDLLLGDEWFEMQGRLRVFGNRMVRDDFDLMMRGTYELFRLERVAVAGEGADDADVQQALYLVREHGARVRTAVSAEVGPLRDIIMRPKPHWWQARRRGIERLRTEQGEEDALKRRNL